MMIAILLPLAENSIYLYETEDSPSLEFFDCVYHQNLFYCRRPSGPILLQRDETSKDCYHNGTPYSFVSLLSKNISVSTVLHQWKSSIEKVEQYSRYIQQQIKSMNDDENYLCECHHPQSFGKNCEYLLPINNNTFEATLDWEVQMKFFNQDQSQIHSDIVCYTTLKCNSGILCLDWRDICDGIQHCMFGYDEENCDILEFNECEDDEYRCMNGMCIPDEYFLDGDYDCMDITDEKNSFNDMICTFQQVTIECDDRICLPNQWSCGDGQCINKRLAFQQFLSPDRECNSRRDQFHMCETHVIRNQWTLSNGKCDEPGADEELNFYNPITNQRCIYYLKCILPNELAHACSCGSYPSCILYLNVRCASIYYPDGQIVAPYIRHIYNKFDNRQMRTPDIVEINGTIKCRGFMIEQRMTLPYSSEFNLRNFEAQLCNKFSDKSVITNGGYDRSCYNESLTMNNRSYYFIDVCKKSRECISAYRIKDGIQNCADRMDEEKSDSIKDTCYYVRHHRFRCSINESTCLFAYFLGNDIADCKNKYDESWMGTNVALSEINCNRESKKDCQLIRQYIENSWNSNIDITSFEQIKVTKIPFRRFCDTFYNLGTKMDEDISLCQKWWKCLDEQWQCRTGQCIDVKWVLDGEWDCKDASDEEGLFASNDTLSMHNLKLISISVLIKSFNDLYSSQPFSNICNLTTEYPCFRVDVTKPLVNITFNRPCISLEQLGDEHIDCMGGIDERNTIQHCTLPTTLGRDFLCVSSQTCIDIIDICKYQCPNSSDNYVLCNNRIESSDCLNRYSVRCIDGQCKEVARCDSRAHCSYGEDEYMCDRTIYSNDENVLYRKKKELEINNLKQKLQLPQLHISMNHIKPTNFTISTARIAPTVVHTTNLNNLLIPYVCNRGVGVHLYNASVACFCPPQYYGNRCQFHSDRVSVILHLNLLQSIYTQFTDPSIVLKLLILFLFENQILTIREFSVRPAMEIIIYKKMIHHFVYSRSNQSLHNKQMRYFNRSNIVREHPYAIRIESYELTMNEKTRLMAVWQYPIYFDYLPSFRLSKVLRLTKSDNINNPCSSNPCTRYHECHQLQNQRSAYVCLCPSNFTGADCSVLDRICTNGFCSRNSLCKPNYHSLLSGNKTSYCICPLNTFGKQCDLIHDSCIQNPCRNNATCLTSEKPNEFLCVCTSGYYGKLCELEKQAVGLYINNSIIHRGAVVQYFKINFISLDLILAYQRVFSTLPEFVFNFHGEDTAPEIILIKLYSDKQMKIHLISVQINATSINETIQLSEKNHCMSVITLWQRVEEIFPIKYHHLCMSNHTLLCFYDEEYLCICSEQNVRAECFGYDHHLDQCSRCLAGGRCLQEDRLQTQDFLCLCPQCHRGSLCQFNTEIQSFLLDSLFAEIGFNVELLYLTLVILIVMIGAVNNYASFVTFKRPNPRKFGVGKYLLLISILSQCSLLALFGETMQILFKSLLNDISCKILSYMLSVFTRCSFWLTSWVTLERLFLVIFPFNNLLKKSYVTWTTIFITLIVVNSMHAHELVFYVAIEDPNRQMICAADFTQNWLTYNRITLMAHYIVPFGIQIVSITVLIVLTARSRLRTTGNKRNTFIQVLKQQFSSQKEHYITPLIMILSSLPQVVLSFIFACTELSAYQRHTLLIAYFLSYAPQLLGFVLFVLPSTNYSKEFRETQLAKRSLFKWMISQSN